MKNSNNKEEQIDNNGVGNVVPTQENKGSFLQQLDDKWFHPHDSKKALEDAIKDYSKAHPMMKQQYTYKDLQDAFNAGSYSDEYIMNGSPIPTFKEWYNDHQFEMYDGK